MKDVKKVKQDDKIFEEVDQTHLLLTELDYNNTFAAYHDINEIIKEVRKMDRVKITVMNKDQYKHEFDREVWANENGNYVSKLSILLGIAGNHLTDEEYAGFMLSISFKQEHKKELENCLKYLTFDDIFISKEAFKVYFTSCIRGNDNSEKDALRIIPVMMNTYHNLCNGINVFQDDNGRNLGEKSQDEMRQKYKEVVNKFGPEIDNDECMRPQPYLKQITEA